MIDDIGRKAATLCACAMLLMAPLSLLTLAAEPEAASTTATKLNYRRIFVPAENVDAWPRGGEKFIPVEARDFEDMLTKANRQDSPSTSAAQIDAAEYSARLDDDGRLRGHGHWNISTSKNGPGFLALSNVSPAIRDAHWSNALNSPVGLGVWSASGGGPGVFGVSMPKGGTLEFTFDAQLRSQSEDLQFPWITPAAMISRVILDLPDGKRPDIDGAVVLESTAIPNDSDKEAQPRRKWVLAVSPSPNAVLRITSADRTASEVGHRLRLREEVSFHIEQRGLEISATWHLDGPMNTERELTLPLPAGVQLVAVDVGGRELKWRVVRGKAPAADKAIISILSEADASSLSVTLTAWQPLTIDQSWQLPILHPEGVFWSTGQLNISIAPEFELLNLTPVNCSQTAAAQAAGDGSRAERLSLAACTPTATAELTIARCHPEVTVRTGASLVLADPDVTGRLVTEWNVLKGRVHRFSGEIAPGWSVEAVETVPSDAMAEWFIDPQANRRMVEVELTDAASSARSVTVIVTARLQRFSVADTISADTLRMIRWSGARVSRQLLSFQTSDPFAVEATGDLPILTRDAISDSDRMLLDANSDATRFIDLAHAAQNAGVKLSVKRGQYASDVELDASYTKGELRQVWRVAARPIANPIDRLLVFATTPVGDSNFHWVATSTNTPIVAERVATDDPLRKELPRDGESWLLHLPQPTSKLIEVSASMTSVASKRISIPLLALPEAVEQHGRAFIRGNVASSPWIEPDGLTPIPLPIFYEKEQSADTRPPIRAAFRYSPLDCVNLARRPRLWIASTSQDASPIKIRHLNLESYIWPDGRASHAATYELESEGATEFKPNLPPDARVTAVVVDGRSIESATTDGTPPVAPIPLPVGLRSTSVVIYFDTFQIPLAELTAVTYPLLHSAAPAFHGEWTAWIPNEFSADAGDQAMGVAFSWRDRLFGPLAASHRGEPFQPLHASDWAHLFDWAVDGGRETANTAIAPTTDNHNGPVSVGKPLNNDSQRLEREIPSAALSPNSPHSDDKHSDLPGWHAIHQSFVADSAPNSITVSRHSAISSWAVCVLIACFLVGYELLDRKPKLLLSAITVAACLAILLPGAVAPLATGALWGLMLSRFGTWVRRSEESQEPLQASFKRAVVAGCLVGLCAIAVTGVARAETESVKSPSTKTNAASVIDSVLIPVDANKHVVGTKYYLAEKFLRELLQSRSKEVLQESQWVLRGALYRGDLSEVQGRSEVTAGTWSLAFSIETFARDTSIVLPLAEGQAEWQPTAMLDGVPVPISWNALGNECAIAVVEPGQYTLTVFCVPKTTSVNDQSEISLSVPLLPVAEIQFRAPVQLTDIRVSNATLQPAMKESPGDYKGELTQASRVNLRWPRIEQKSNTSQGPSITELNWLHVGASGIELETKYIVEGGARHPESLTIQYGNDWSPLGSASPHEKEKVAAKTSPMGSLRIQLPGDTADRQEVSVRWRLNDPTTVGVLQLPPVALASVPVAQRWFALSTDPALDCTIVDNHASSTTPKEFLVKWGGYSEALMPQVVLANVDTNRSWTVAIRPRENESVVREVLHVAVGLQTARVVYQANVTPGNSNRFQFRLTVPPKLNIEEILLSEADRQIPTRWTKDGENHVNVFFSDAARSDYRLTLSGSIPIAPNSPLDVPRVSSASASFTKEQVQLYRDDNVDVKLLAFPIADELKPGLFELSPIQWLVRPVGVYHLDDTAFNAARIIATPANSEIKGDRLTSLVREGGTWWAVFRAHLTAKQGNLDVLRLQFPPLCTGPFEVESSVPASTDTSTDGARNQIAAIRFTSSITQGGEVELQVRSPLMIPSGEAMEVPGITVVAPVHGSRYATTPTQLDSQPLAWTEIGVKKAVIPEKLLHSSSKLANTNQYEIVTEPFHIGMQTQSTTVPKPRIPLADTATSIGEHGAQLIVTRFVVLADGLVDCMLSLPPDQNLLSADLNGRPALTTADGDSRWRVMLNSSQLPQVLEVVTRAAPSATKEKALEVRRPSLRSGSNPIAVEVGLWSLAEPAGALSGEAEGAAAANALDQAALRLDRLVSIAESAGAAAAEVPRPEGANWFRPWATLLRDVQSQAKRIAAQPAGASTIAKIARSSEDQINGASQRLDKWLQESIDWLGDSETAAMPNTGTPADDFVSRGRFATSSPAEQDLTYYVAENGSDCLTVNRSATAASSRQTQMFVLLTIIGLAIVGWWLADRRATMDFLSRWPQAVGFVIGLAYWAWLWPSWLGLLFAAICVWRALRNHWPGHSYRPEASTVLRSTRAH